MYRIRSWVQLIRTHRRESFFWMRRSNFSLNREFSVRQKNKIFKSILHRKMQFVQKFQPFMKAGFDSLLSVL